MRRGARQASAEFAFLSPLGAAGGATNREGWIFGGLHNRIVNRIKEKDWSILTSFHIHTVLRGPTDLSDRISGCELSCSDARFRTCHSYQVECANEAATAD